MSTQSGAEEARHHPRAPPDEGRRREDRHGHRLRRHRGAPRRPPPASTWCWSATRVGMVVQGHDSTLPVTLDQMIYHSAAVRRGLDRDGARAHLVGDMPFGSYQASVDDGGQGRDAARRRGRRRGGEARGRRRLRRGDPPDRPRRRAGDGPHRPHAAVGPQDGRLRGAGEGLRQGAADPAGRARPRGRRVLRGGARVHPRRARPDRHGPAPDPDHRHRRGPARATARCSSSTTSSRSTPPSRPSS